MDTFKPLRENKSQEIESSELASRYLSAAVSDNTRLAYRNDIAHFVGMGFELPANPDQLQQYLLYCLQ